MPRPISIRNRTLYTKIAKGTKKLADATSVSSRSSRPSCEILPRRVHAFTLVEVMVAATILVVGFIGMIEAVAITSNTMDHARRQTLAAQILNHEIEKLRLYSWSQIQAVTATSPTPAIDSQFNTAIAASGATYTITRAVADPTTNLREITYTVQWTVTTSRRDAGNNLLTFTYTRVNTAWFGKYGLNLSYQRS